jgi:hypothetical protein
LLEPCTDLSIAARDPLRPGLFQLRRGQRVEFGRELACKLGQNRPGFLDTDESGGSDRGCSDEQRSADNPRGSLRNGLILSAFKGAHRRRSFRTPQSFYMPTLAHWRYSMAKSAKTVHKKPKPRPCTPVCEVNNPDLQPFQERVEVSLPPTFGGENGFVTVPAGKRLVIEYISGQAFLPTGQKALFSVIVSLQGQTTGTWHFLESTAVGAFGGEDCFQCGRPVRLYADAGTTVMLRTDRDLTVGTGISRMTLSGHLIST